MKPVIPTEFKRHHLGVDQGSPLTSTPNEALWDSLNMECNELGKPSTRPGTTRFTNAAMNGKVTRVFDFRKSDSSQQIMAWSGKILYDITSGTPSTVLSGLSFNAVPGVTLFQNRMYWGNGIDSNYKYDGTNMWDVSLEEPTGFPTLDVSQSGSISIVTSQKYVVTFYNTTTGEESNPYSPDDLTAATNTGVITSKKVVVTRPAAPTDAQVSHWRIYKTTDGGSSFLRHATVAIATPTYDDNVTVPSTTTALVVNNDRAPLSSIWCSAFGSIFIVPNSDLSSIAYSKAGNGASFPSENRVYAGRDDNDPIKGMQFKNNLVWIMKERSSWVLSSHPDDGGVPIKVSDKGTVNQYAFDGSDQIVYSFAKNKAFYQYRPTEQALTEIRYSLRSYNLKKFMDSANEKKLQYVRVLNYTGKTKNQIWVGIPSGKGIDTIDKIAVYDTVLSKLAPNDESWWFYKFGFDISSLNLVNIDGEDVVLIGSDDGWVHKYPDITGTYGDSAAFNGTVTGATTTTLSDTSQSWTTNALAGIRITVLSGTGAFQERQIVSNTANQVTVAAWETTPAVGATFTVGGYNHYLWTNWKAFGAEGLRKRSRGARVVMEQGGNYTVDCMARRSFKLKPSDKSTETFNLTGPVSFFDTTDSIFGFFEPVVVVKDIRFSGQFNSIQYGYQNRRAKEPFALEMMTTFHQELYWRSDLL